MTLQERLNELIEELDRVHPGGMTNPEVWNFTEHDGLPNFVTASNGQERHFTKKAQTALQDIVGILHENNGKISALMEKKKFQSLTKKCIADLHAAGSLDLSVHSIDQVRKSLNEAIEESVSTMQLTFTHYFPGWTIGMESKAPYVLGPVAFMTMEQWINSVEFAPEAIQRYANAPEANLKWKESLLRLLAEHSPTNDADVMQEVGLAKMMYFAIRGYPSILKVAINGYELELSRRVAEMICKSALDAVSLLFGGKDYFYQQALAHEHLPPVSVSSILETDGHLWLPGTTWGPRVRLLSYPGVRDYLTNNSAILEAFASILNTLVDPSSSTHPNLAKRWSTALDWFAEGQRERNDAVALAKIGTSLDVLACCGRYAGILKMLAHLLNCNEATIVVKRPSPLTLAQVVERIYEKGRSRILHGTEFDRIKTFEVSRSHAAVLGRLALLEGALRLKNFSGADEDKEFRTIPA